MSRKRFDRYGGVDVPSETALYRMYKDEGMDEAQAREKAKELHRYLDSAGRAEARFWKKVRENEMTDGLEPDTPQSKEQRYAFEER